MMMGDASPNDMLDVNNTRHHSYERFPLRKCTKSVYYFSGILEKFKLKLNVSSLGYQEVVYIVVSDDRFYGFRKFGTAHLGIEIFDI
ncbi:hypothetical protein EVAR_88339_1 [Eumeta japonica]|uniref:Uncharacterized protein n=1 Tax=Eumeta variegata TaxID=151549 RepID=A0A4C1YAJ3_EUMVA|nr:hypothetical protein EVAR_88339_1 [Eumeta japonica]